jgi:hypothetical protein
MHLNKSWYNHYQRAMCLQNLSHFNTSFTHLLLLKIALVVSINTAIAGGGNIELNRFTEVDTSSAYNDNAVIEPSVLRAAKALKLG